jgi:hypothetical protein
MLFLLFKHRNELAGFIHPLALQRDLVYNRVTTTQSVTVSVYTTL